MQCTIGTGAQQRQWGAAHSSCWGSTSTAGLASTSPRRPARSTGCPVKSRWSRFAFLYIGMGEQLSAVHFKTLVLKEAEIIASRVTRGEFPRAIRLLAKGLLHPELLITDQMALGDGAAAFEQVDQEDPSTIKVVLNVQEV